MSEMPDPKEVGDYYAGLMSDSKGYTRELTNQFFRLATSLLLADFLRRQKFEGQSPRVIADQLFANWEAQVKELHAAEAKKHTEMAQTPLGRLLSDTLGDGEKLRLFFKRHRDESAQMIKTMLDALVECTEIGG